jgi:hypothetical protein
MRQQLIQLHVQSRPQRQRPWHSKTWLHKHAHSVMQQRVRPNLGLHPHALNQHRAHRQTHSHSRLVVAIKSHLVFASAKLPTRSSSRLESITLPSSSQHVYGFHKPQVEAKSN